MNTMLWITFSVLASVLSVTSQEYKAQGHVTNIYEKVKNGFYKEVLQAVKSLNPADSGNIIESVVNKLLEDNHKNILNFAFQLWEAGEQNIVLKYFPPSYKMLFNHDEVKFVNQIKNLAMTYRPDQETVTAERDSPSADYKTRWIVVPIWNINRVLFNIRRVAAPLYLAVNTGLTGYTSVVLTEDVTKNNIVWTFEPFYKNNKTYFYVVNGRFSTPLTVGESNELISEQGVPYDCSSGCWSINECDPRIHCSGQSCLQNDLLDSLESGSFQAALVATRKLHNSNEGIKLNKIFKFVLSKRRNNFMGFIAYGWQKGMADILTHYIPDSLKLILQKEKVKITNYKYGLPLKLDINTVDGDRLVWGSNITIPEERLLWTFEYVLDQRRFVIINVDKRMHLKVEVDDNLKKKAWGNNLLIWNFRFHHLVSAFEHKGEILFEINNEQTNRLYTLDDVNVEGGDRALLVVWEVDKNDDPMRTAWRISK